MKSKQHNPRTVWTTGSTLDSDRSSSSRGCGVRLIACRPSPHYQKYPKNFCQRNSQMLTGHYKEAFHCHWFHKQMKIDNAHSPLGPKSWMNDSWLTSMNSIWEKIRKTWLLQRHTSNSEMYNLTNKSKRLKELWLRWNYGSEMDLKCARKWRVASTKWCDARALFCQSQHENNQSGGWWLMLQT